MRVDNLLTFNCSVMTKEEVITLLEGRIEAYQFQFEAATLVGKSHEAIRIANRRNEAADILKEISKQWV